MKTVRDLTLDELFAEGRRWIIAPGDYADGEGYQVRLVVENHPFPFVVGSTTNIPSLAGGKLPHFAASTDSIEAREEAKIKAACWCEQHSGIDRATYLSIVSSAIRAYQLGKRVRVTGKIPEEMEIANGFGDRMKLDAETAARLHRDLAIALELPCPDCGKYVDDANHECSG